MRAQAFMVQHVQGQGRPKNYGLAVQDMKWEPVDLVEGYVFLTVSFTSYPC